MNLRTSLKLNFFVPILQKVCHLSSHLVFFGAGGGVGGTVTRGLHVHVHSANFSYFSSIVDVLKESKDYLVSLEQ